MVCHYDLQLFLMNAFVITIIMLWENHGVTGGQCRSHIGAVVMIKKRYGNYHPGVTNTGMRICSCLNSLVCTSKCNITS
jgi:hypothetical protein